MANQGAGQSSTFHSIHYSPATAPEYFTNQYNGNKVRFTPPPPYGSASGWMKKPEGTVDCPPGLEYLQSVDQLVVIQKVEAIDVITDFDMPNRYFITNNLGQKMYYAIEDTDWIARNVCETCGPFRLRIFDNFENEVIHLYKPYACGFCYLPFGLESMEVSLPTQEVVGLIRQKWTLLHPSFIINNSNEETVFKVKGPFCTRSFGRNVNFKVMTAEGETQVGIIAKQWAGFLQEMLTDVDNFGISFPMDLDVRMKALLIGMCFLIDFMYFD